MAKETGWLLEPPEKVLLKDLPAQETHYTQDGLLIRTGLVLSSWAKGTARVEQDSAVKLYQGLAKPCTVSVG